MIPRYEATHYPGMGAFLDAIDEHGQRHHDLFQRALTICDCRSYATANGFTVETVHREDGLAVFTWRKPEAA